MSIFRWLRPSRTDDLDGEAGGRLRSQRFGWGDDLRSEDVGPSRPPVPFGRALVQAESRLVAGAEAFLTGCYAGHLRRHGDRIPDWVRLNSLAHGDIDSLRRCERPRSMRNAASITMLTDDSWSSAMSMLAAELIELTGGDPDLLARLQQRALVPLEFRLMSEHHLTAFELVQLTRATLRSSIS